MRRGAVNAGAARLTRRAASQKQVNWCGAARLTRRALRKSKRIGAGGAVNAPPASTMQVNHVVIYVAFRRHGHGPLLTLALINLQMRPLWASMHASSKCYIFQESRKENISITRSLRESSFFVTCCLRVLSCLPLAPKVPPRCLPPRYSLDWKLSCHRPAFPFL